MAAEAEDAPDLVMRLYWDCQKLQETISKLEGQARRDCIVRSGCS